MGVTLDRHIRPDYEPVVISPGNLTERMHTYDVPAALRQHAREILSDRTHGPASYTVWWAIGTFSHRGTDVTVAASWHPRHGAAYALTTD